MHKKSEKSYIEANKSNKDFNKQTDELLLTFDEQKKSAEIRYAALITEKNIPHQTAKEIQFLSRHRTRCLNVLKSMNMSQTKCKNIISNVLCSVETERVVNNIQNTKFSVFIDETSDITNEKYVRSQLVKLIDIDAKDCSAEKLFNVFEITKFQIPFLNIVVLSCDNASVMTGKHLSFKKKLKSKCKSLLIFSCLCHSVSCTRCIKIASYINSSPKRLSIFNEFCECFQDTNYKILKLCGTRWLSLYFCIDRVLESWDSIKYFFNEMVMNDKTKSGKYLLSLIKNVDIRAYYLFLKYVLNFFNSFNAFFQAHETRVHIHLLQSKIVNFLIQISENFLKPELLKNLVTNISFYEKKSQKNLLII
ncbi:hypothetical protein ACFW04_014198 [Cataglyphis niger]